MDGLRLGILVDSFAKQQALAQLVAQSGHQLACQLLVERDAATPQDLPLDAWLVDIAESCPDDHHLLEKVFSESRVPIIFSDSSEFPAGSAEHQACLRRTGQRLQRLAGDVGLQQARPAQDLWVLAASTGGPAAVKRFLAQVPDNLGVIFLYVQHIDHNQAAPLSRMMTSAGGYPARAAQSGMVLEANRVVLVTALDHVEILENRTLNVQARKGWNGDYAPSIDQISANAARIYRRHCGLIIFTGMGDDGADACRLVSQMGGRVWAQTPADCVSDSMPVSAIATGCVALTGTPETLAESLTRLYH